MDDEIKQHEKLLQLIRDTIQLDDDLREKYQVGNKFRFVRDRLQNVLTHLEEQQRVSVEAVELRTQQEEAQNQVVVFVYLYNAQGLVLRSWAAMLTPKVFYEYSVNRPVYTDQNLIESLIRTKTNKQQHGYFSIKINREDILSSPDSSLKDAGGNPLIKVKEGSLRFENMVLFYHNDQNYMVNVHGEFIKKE